MSGRVGIGISTYNDTELTGQLLESIASKTDFKGDYQIAVVDDGTTDKDTLDNLAMVCRIHDAELVLNKENQGIPFTWNRIVKTLHNDYGCEDIIILNNDLAVLDENWLRYLVFFLDNNEKIGTVGLPLVQVNRITGELEEYNEELFGTKPSSCGAAVGCCFGLKYDTWRLVKNEDNSVGFFEGLRSFHEEVNFGLRLAADFKYPSYMLPYPPMAHYGGATFATNPELTEMKLPTREKIELPINKEEYVEAIKKAKSIQKLGRRIG